MSLTGHHAVITGGGRGIGAAIAHTLADQGVNLTLLGRTRTPLERVKAQLSPRVKVQYLLLDLAEASSISPTFQQATAAFGPVDMLINNAGLAQSARFEHTELDQLRAMLDVNLIGSFLCCQAALSSMRHQPWGRIINIASTAGLKGYSYVSAYCASKHGMIGFTRALALELAQSAITVNAVCPGYTETDMLKRSLDTIQAKTDKSPTEAKRLLSDTNPQKRLIQPDEVAHTVLWLCQATSAAITGQSIVVAGGEIM